MSRPQTVSTDEIIEVARAHFLKRGHSATLNAIARDLGLSHSALIQRFGSKRQLLIESMRPPEDFSWSEAFIAGPPADPTLARAQLEEAGEMLMKSLSDLMPQIRVLQAAGVELCEIFDNRLPLPLVACKQLTEWIERGVARGVFRCIEPASVSSLMISAMFFRARLQQLCALSNPEELTREPFEASLIGSHRGVLNVIAHSLSLLPSPS